MQISRKPSAAHADAPGETLAAILYPAKSLSIINLLRCAGIEI